MRGERCWWCGDDPLSVAYHDHAWGFPVGDDRRLFETLVQGAFRSDLSWLTILRKRQNVRHRGRIEAAVANARAALGLIERHGSLAALVLRFEPPAGAAARRARTAFAVPQSSSRRA